MKDQHKVRLLYGLFLALQTASYFLIGVLSERFSLSLYSVRSVFDEMIPFLPQAIFPYTLYLFLMAAPLFFSMKKGEARRLLSRLITASVLAFALSFVHAPSPSPRPDLKDEEGGLLISLVRLLYQADISPIHFPSLHALHSLLIGMQFWSRAGAFRLLLPCALLVSVSTVFVKQHFFYDAAASLIAAPLIFRLFSSRRKPALR